MLTDPACKQATCPQDKPRVRLADERGLYLEVAPNGSKRWFFKYRFAGKEKRLALGNYPEVTLKVAREGRDDARKTRAAGTDPVQQRQQDNANKQVSSASTYEAVAREFHSIQAAAKWSSGHARKWLRTQELYLFPEIGTLPLSSIRAAAILRALRKVEAKGIVNTAHELRTMAGQVFRHGVVTERCEKNPIADLKDALTAHHVKHFAAVLDPVEVGGLLRAIDGYTGQPATRAALQLSALIFQRPGNIRAMEWEWIDLDAALLTIPAQSMKLKTKAKVNGRPHLVPLARQAVGVLKEIQPLTGHSRYVFPGARDHAIPMSDGTVNAALRRLDFGSDDHVAHGFRAMARTMLAERIAGISSDMVEAQLGHAKTGANPGAYDRAEYADQRRLMMQTWADYLDQLRTGAQVIPFKATSAR
ncbi:integrase [Paucibacter oligotrophus]|uniref:Integrase n=1 Tax=Roseateles oligotrophus TaxID=1769250 RepID=A0A840L6G2_9BURK|nr:site-specific integrase [Roseateles oligotrophus]MBB4843381.1 integrase [Roseateles oligotrophus]